MIIPCCGESSGINADVNLLLTKSFSYSMIAIYQARQGEPRPSLAQTGSWLSSIPSFGMVWFLITNSAVNNNEWPLCPKDESNETRDVCSTDG